MTPGSPSPVVQFVTSSAFQELKGTEYNMWAHFFPFFFCFKEIKDTQKKGGGRGVPRYHFCLVSG